jgi:hypothetical protein
MCTGFGPSTHTKREQTYMECPKLRAHFISLLMTHEVAYSGLEGATSQLDLPERQLRY